MNMKSGIIPIPREYTALRMPPAVLGFPGRADFAIVSGTDPASSAVLAPADKLLGDTLGKLLNVCPSGAKGAVTVSLRPGKAPDGVPNAEQARRIRCQRFQKQRRASR